MSPFDSMSFQDAGIVPQWAVTCQVRCEVLLKTEYGEMGCCKEQVYSVSAQQTISKAEEGACQEVVTY